MVLDAVNPKTLELKKQQNFLSEIDINNSRTSRCYIKRPPEDEVKQADILDAFNSNGGKFRRLTYALR